MIEEFVTRTFATRNAVHLAHWKTGSFAEHMALGDLYEEIIESIDDIVEAHQGICGKIDVKGTREEKEVDDIIKHLKGELLYISKNRNDITNKQPAIDNLVQELERHYMKALYKLRDLS